MAKYIYVSNKDPQDGTEFVSLPGGEPVPQGGTIELNEAEHALLSGRLNFKEVKEEQGASSTKGEDRPDSRPKEVN